jgi:hypothetical protein
MARLAVELVKQREAEVIQAFADGVKTGNKVKAKAVNDALFAKYGTRMASKRISELRKQFKEDTKTDEVPAPTVTE